MTKSTPSPGRSNSRPARRPSRVRADPRGQQRRARPPHRRRALARTPAPPPTSSTSPQRRSPRTRS
eukprot:3419183-Alexandrium_andersonii.AAC.1